jgi:hypothetical protein
VTQEITIVPVDNRTADWPRKVATVLNRLQRTTMLAGGSATWGSITGTLSLQTDLNSALSGKQATLVSGTNIKSVNGSSLLGSGNLSVGTVTSVGASVPSGLSIAGSPITGSGTLAITFAAGYSLPTDAAQANWNTAFGWGNHASAGYLTSSAIGVSVQAYDAQLDSLAALTYVGNALKVVRVNAGATGFELATVSAGLSDGDYGDITVGGSGTTLTIDNDVVTYAKMQNVSATSRILGRKTASAGDPEECTLSEILDFIGSAAQGDILYRGASGWARLGAGTSGQFLKTNGTGANPSWASATATAWDFSPPTAASFSLQSGDATNMTLTDDSDVGLLVDSGTAVNTDVQRFMYRTLTTPSGDFDFKVKIDIDLGGNFSACGILLRDNTGGRNVSLQVSSDGVGRVDKGYATSMTTFSARTNYYQVNHDQVRWLRVVKSGSNFTFYMSINGKQWRSLVTESVTAHLASAPNRVGIFMRTSATTVQAAISYFSLTGSAV